MLRLAVNLIAFQIAWFACVLGGAHGWPWLGVGVAALVVALHLRLSDAPRREAMLLVLVGVIGAVWDGFLVRFGFLEYPSGMLLPWLAPVWIIAMWVAFATTLNVALSWLKGRWTLAVVLGAIGGPLAFYGGHKLGAVAFPDTVVAMAVLAGGWSFLMPLSAWLAQRFDGAGFPKAPALAPLTQDSAHV
ncbi:DUF2878 domain-containing protein [Thiocapsa marina]|uniref:DUF2878 domain-containing protein n=1 Tax=Thiocapsa marina 5811 TaxID=768671 RepID=F9UIB0_9GAMM|nr:DUF2878 domain-containing protein [Thiocapsa marina]EGV16062.1 hypothetical protein ThimaDRAFT_4663 [Thiocapsa marina 5811]